MPFLPLLLPAVVFFAAGVWFVVKGRRIARAGAEFERLAATTEAEITDLRFQTQSVNVEHDDGFWTPVVRFALPDGRVVESETLVGARPAPGKVGDRVVVRYDPERPERVNLAHGLARPGNLGLLLTVLGSALATFGGLLLLVWLLLVFR